MENPTPASAKPTSAKNKWVVWLVIFVLFVGVPVVLYVINRNAPVDPNADRVTITYYKGGVQTSIPESSTEHAAMQGDVKALVGFVDNYSDTAGSRADAELAMGIEAVEFIFGSTQSVGFFNANLASTTYNRVLIVPMPDPDTVKVIFGFDTYTTKQAFYTGGWATSLLTAARGYKPAVNQ